MSDLTTIDDQETRQRSPYILVSLGGRTRPSKSAASYGLLQKCNRGEWSLRRMDANCGGHNRWSRQDGQSGWSKRRGQKWWHRHGKLAHGICSGYTVPTQHDRGCARTGSAAAMPHQSTIHCVWYQTHPVKDGRLSIRGYRQADRAIS